MASLWRDIRYGLRMLAKNPGFRATVILILGLDVGANTAVVNAQERKEITGKEIAKWHSEEILERFQIEGVPSAPLLDRMELMDHEQIIANQTILRDMYEGFGEVRQARPAATFEKTPSQIIRPAPKLGEHGKEILDNLDIGREEQKRLSKEGKVIILE